MFTTRSQLHQKSNISLKGGSTISILSTLIHKRDLNQTKKLRRLKKNLRKKKNRRMKKWLEKQRTIRYQLVQTLT